jgi:hypothetical protein
MKGRASLVFQQRDLPQLRNMYREIAEHGLEISDDVGVGWSLLGYVSAHHSRLQRSHFTIGDGVKLS